MASRYPATSSVDGGAPHSPTNSGTPHASAVPVMVANAALSSLPCQPWNKSTVGS